MQGTLGQPSTTTLRVLPHLPSCFQRQRPGACSDSTLDEPPRLRRRDSRSRGDHRVNLVKTSLKLSSTLLGGRGECDGEKGAEVSPVFSRFA